MVGERAIEGRCLKGLEYLTKEFKDLLSRSGSARGDEI